MHFYTKKSKFIEVYKNYRFGTLSKKPFRVFSPVPRNKIVLLNRKDLLRYEQLRELAKIALNSKRSENSKKNCENFQKKNS